MKRDGRDRPEFLDLKACLELKAKKEKVAAKALPELQVHARITLYTRALLIDIQNYVFRIQVLKG